jgi:hypothetical protein
MPRCYRPRPVIDRRMRATLEAIAAGQPLAHAIRATKIPRRTFYNRYRKLLESREVPARGLAA